MYVVGDNKKVSYDSRYKRVGWISRDRIVGEAVLYKQHHIIMKEIKDEARFRFTLQICMITIFAAIIFS